MPDTQNGPLVVLAQTPPCASFADSRSRDYWHTLALAVLALCDEVADPDLNEQVASATIDAMHDVRA